MKQFRVPLQITIASFFSYLLAVLCTRWFTGEPSQMAALWAVISALVVVQDSLEGTEEAFGIRFLGSLIGSAMAVACFLLFPINAFSVAGAMLVTAGLCALLKFEKHMRLACLTLVLLLLVHDLSPNQPIWYFALWRLFDSIIGSVVAFVVVREFLWLKI